MNANFSGKVALVTGKILCLNLLYWFVPIDFLVEIQQCAN